MIVRIWKGTTSPDNAHKYEQLLKEVVFPGIEQMEIAGYHGIQLLKNTTEMNVGYVTIMTFENWEAVKKFAGDDYAKSYVIDAAKALLQCYDPTASHYEVIHTSIQ